MQKKFLLLLTVFFLQGHAHGQRWYNINDSTSYSFDDINIVVGKRKLYRNQDNALTLVRDFSDVIPVNNYIRDFDFIDAQNWYVLIGLTYISGDTKLYRTNDAGANWELILPESFTVPDAINGKAESINQVQFTNGRIYLFDSYYVSRVFYSDDMGQTWNHWFEGVWSHYYHMFTCGSELYLQGMPGDGFSGYMFRIPESYIGQQNILATTIGECVNGTGIGCSYAPPDLNIPQIYAYFETLFENEVCPSLNVQSPERNAPVLLPNPTSGIVSVNGIDTALPFEIKVYNELGQLIGTMNRTELDFSPYPRGMYILNISQGDRVFKRKILKK